MEIALYQPDIPQNTGTILRLGACLGINVHIIEPTGFVWSVASLRRAGMDYIDQVAIKRHDDFESFCEQTKNQRKILLTTKVSTPYWQESLKNDDILLLGSESNGVPKVVHHRVDCQVTIPMQRGMRSLNVAVACAMVLGWVAAG